MRDLVVNAWVRWVAYMRELAARGDDLTAIEKRNKTNARLAASIRDPAQRRAVQDRIDSALTSAGRQREAYALLVSRSVQVHAVLYQAIKFYDATVLAQLPAPAVPSSPGVGVVFTLPVILGAVAAVGVLVGSLAALSYWIGASKRNSEAETKIIDGMLRGIVTPGDAGGLIEVLRPPSTSAGLLGSVPWFVWVGAAGLVAWQLGLFGRRRA